jgi:hypothetical protein
MSRERGTHPAVARRDGHSGHRGNVRARAGGTRRGFGVGADGDASGGGVSVTDTYRDPALALMGVDFRECAACAAKPGAPNLCEACIHNRRVINALVASLTQVVSITRIECESIGKLTAMADLEHERCVECDREPCVCNDGEPHD